MAILTVPATIDFSALFLADVTLVWFTGNTSATATFAASQFDDIQIVDDVLIAGNGLSNHFVVNGGSVDATAWIISTWDASVDSITFKGTALRDVISGSSTNDALFGHQGDDHLSGGGGDDDINGGYGADIINGGEGTDTLSGGRLNDDFVFSSALDAESGESIDGGGGNHDRIVVDADGANVGFYGFTIAGIEELKFKSGSIAVFDAENFGAGHIALVTGGSGGDSLSVYGSIVDLSGVVFANWTENSSSFVDDHISISGDNDANTLTGSVMSDTIYSDDGEDVLSGNQGDDSIFPQEGRDSVYGEGGDDQIIYFHDTEISSGELIDGGSGGGDELVLDNDAIAQHYDLSVALLTGVEAIRFRDTSAIDGTVTAAFSEAQIGASGVTAITFDYETSLEISGGAIDISDVDFDGTALASSTASLTGISGADVLIGGSLDDTINGGSGLDVMIGNGGSDTFLFAGAAELGTGEYIDGGNGSGDTILLSSAFAGIADLILLQFLNIERIEMDAAFQTVEITGDQAAGLTEIEGTLGPNNVNVFGSDVDLRFLTFINWADTDLVSIFGTDGIDTLTASYDEDWVEGGAGGDVIKARGGDDTIYGGEGNDVLTGGSGYDTFLYATLGETGTGPNRDLIIDFTQGEDAIDLSFASPQNVIGSSQFSANGVAELRYTETADSTIIRLDQDGDGVSDFEILLDTALALTVDDFVL